MNSGRSMLRPYEKTCLVGVNLVFSHAQKGNLFRGKSQASNSEYAKIAQSRLEDDLFELFGQELVRT
jgi:hypothetical protein